MPSLLLNPLFISQIFMENIHTILDVYLWVIHKLVCVQENEYKWFINSSGDIFRCMMADRQKPDFLLKSGGKTSKTGWTETFLISFRKLECAWGAICSIYTEMHCIKDSQTLFVLFRKRSHADGFIRRKRTDFISTHICYLGPTANHCKRPWIRQAGKSFNLM